MLIWMYRIVYEDYKQDDRVCVPKRAGMGYTVNLGNTCGISTMIAIILIPIVIVALILLFQQETLCSWNCLLEQRLG